MIHLFLLANAVSNEYLACILTEIVSLFILLFLAACEISIIVQKLNKYSIPREL